jgi:regulator of cell morphogenesis and NO signaling
MNSSILEFPDWQRTLSMMTDRYGLDNLAIIDDTSLSKAGIDCDFFIQVINLFGSESELPIEQLKSFPIPVILDYLEKTHRYYLNKKLLEIEQSISNLQTQTPENQLLPFLKSFYNWVKDNLIFHIQMEEEQLFPYIKALYHQLDVPSDFSIQHFVEHHSDTVELQISEVKKHIVRAQQSAYEIFPFRVLLKQLDEFEKDLRIHAKIEDEVLIPKAIELENK